MSDAYPEPEADPDVEPDPEPGARRGRLRRAGRKLVRVGGLLLAIALVLTLIGGLTTRNLLDNLRTHSAELLDGVGSVELTAGDERTLYVTGGLITPGEQVPTPVENITCTVQGPGPAVPVNHLKDEAPGQALGQATQATRPCEAEAAVPQEAEEVVEDEVEVEAAEEEAHVHLLPQSTMA